MVTRRAAVSGSPEAALNLGPSLSPWSGAWPRVGADCPSTGFVAAADAKSPDGMAALAYLYAVGFGVPQDSQQALKLARKAAKKEQSASTSKSRGPLPPREKGVARQIQPKL